MASLVAPILVEGRFRGAVSADFTLDQLRATNKTEPACAGR